MLKILKYSAYSALYLVVVLLPAFFSYLGFLKDHNELTNKTALWLSEHSFFTRWHWASIAIFGFIALSVFAWVIRLKKWAKELPIIQDSQTLSRQIKWRFQFTRITYRYRECLSLLLCKRDGPFCSRIHGAAITLTYSLCPFTLIRILVWLKRELDLDSFAFYNHIHLLKLLIKGLKKATNKSNFLWPKEFKREYLKLVMEVYTGVAHNVLRAIQTSCYLNWFNNHPQRYKVTSLKQFPFKTTKIKEYQEKLQESDRYFIHDSWQAFEEIIEPIDEWINSMETAPEIERSLISSVMPRLLNLPLDENFPSSKVNEIIPKLQQFATKIANTVIRARNSYEIDIWLQRLRLVLTSDLLLYLFSWLDIEERQILIKKIYEEIKHLHKEACDESITEHQMIHIWQEFDKQIEIIRTNKICFEEDWTKELIKDIDQLSNEAKKNQPTISITPICNNVKQKFIEIHEQNMKI